MDPQAIYTNFYTIDTVNLYLVVHSHDSNVDITDEGNVYTIDVYDYYIHTSVTSYKTKIYHSTL